MKKIWIIVFLIAILIVAFFIFESKIKVSGYDVIKIDENENFRESKIIFKGEDGKDIYALFFEPLKKKFDVIIVLPGAEGTKESRRHYAEILLEMGYGSFILDQRGIGETDGRAFNFNEDFDAFLRGEETFQFLMAKDVVNAVDVLDRMRNVENIAVLGESMGGRNAIIAGALDERIKEVVVISSAGYTMSFADSRANEFLSLVNPNTYIGRISPRRILILHSINDNVIPISNAEYTFSLAREPKKFVELSEKECIHGYCKQMYDFIKEELRIAFE